MMTGNDPITAAQTADRSRDNRQLVRCLLRMRQPLFAAALESAVQRLLRERGILCPSSVKDCLMTDGSWWPMTGTCSRNRMSAHTASMTRPQLTAVHRSHLRQVTKPGGRADRPNTAWAIGAGE
jgi:hypothetical protein